MPRAQTVAAALLAFLPNASRADVLRFREGGEIVAPSTRDGDSVRIDTPMGFSVFPAADFAEIVEIPEPSEDWPSRLKAAREGGADPLCDAALWALERGLVAEAEGAAREAHAADPRQQPAARMVAALDRLKEEVPDPPANVVARNLPADRRMVRGPHVLLMHQHDEADAAERLALQEQVVAAYMLYFASIGIDLPAPRERLATMWFARKADYLGFLRAEGATAFLATRGYHHPTRNLVVAYDLRDDPERRRAIQEMASARAELDAFAGKIERIPRSAKARIAVRGQAQTLDRASARDLLGTLRRELDHRAIALELTRREVDWAIAAHETVHQLAKATGLAARHDSFPPALGEGLAMQFEAISGGRWAGLGGVPNFRLRDYRALTAAPRFVPSIVPPDFGPGYDASEYARAWAATRFLRTERPTEFVALLDVLRAPAQTLESASARAVRAFAAVRGADSDAAFREKMEELRLGTEPAWPGAHPH